MEKMYNIEWLKTTQHSIDISLNYNCKKDLLYLQQNCN